MKRGRRPKPLIENPVCKTCGTAEARKFYGMRTNNVRCIKCYALERKEANKDVDRTVYYDMWER